MPTLPSTTPLPLPVPAHRVLVLHSQPVIARGLVSILSDMDGVEVCLGPEASVAPAPSVVVCEAGHAGDARAGLHGAAVIVLAPAPREADVQQALARGVTGYLASTCRADELHEAVRTALRGGRFLCQATARAIASGFSNEPLTARELDVLRQLARGSCNKLIAARLDIGTGTVKAHVRSILGKLKASCRTEAAFIATGRGLVEPGGDGMGGMEGMEGMEAMGHGDARHQPVPAPPRRRPVTARASMAAPW